MEAAGQPLVTPDLAATARGLAVDAVSAEVLDALRAAHVPTILLKGPSVAEWLYHQGPGRSYLDTDVLVAPPALADAEHVLAELGFQQCAVVGERGALPTHARAWARQSDQALVDLHRSLPVGVWATPEDVWRTLAASTESMRVGGTTARVLRPAGRALVVALHAAHHGPEVGKPIADLERALDRVDYETWVAAAELAARLDAIGMFADGLRLLPQGTALAERMGLFDARMVESTHHGSSTPLVLGLERLAVAPGILAKLSLLRRELFPPVADLRWWSPMARRGRRGLIAAYAGRVLRFARFALPSLVAWRRIRADIGPRRDARRTTRRP